MKDDARESSVPPPRQVPETAETVGKGRLSQAEKSRWPYREPALGLLRIGDAGDLRDVGAGDEHARSWPKAGRGNRCRSRPASSTSSWSSSARASRVKMLAFLSGRSKVSVARWSSPTSRWKACAI